MLGIGGSLQPKAVRLEHRGERLQGDMLGQGPCAHWPGHHRAAGLPLLEGAVMSQAQSLVKVCGLLALPPLWVEKKASMPRCCDSRGQILLAPAGTVLCGDSPPRSSLARCEGATSLHLEQRLGAAVTVRSHRAEPRQLSFARVGGR